MIATLQILMQVVEASLRWWFCFMYIDSFGWGLSFTRASLDFANSSHTADVLPFSTWLSGRCLPNGAATRRSDAILFASGDVHHEEG